MMNKNAPMRWRIGKPEQHAASVVDAAICGVNVKLRGALERELTEQASGGAQII